MANQDYKFIEEKIIPKKKRLIKEYAKSFMKLVLSGAVFGVTAALTGVFVFNAVGGVKQPESFVNIPADSSPLPVSTPENSQDEDDANKKDADEKDVPKKNNINDMAVDDYAAMCQRVSEFPKLYEDTIVTVAKVTEGIDCFQNPVENSDSFSGLVMRFDSKYMYILTQYDGLQAKSAYQIYFRNGESTRANVLGVDRQTGLAVISAKLDDLSVEVLESARKAIIGDSTKIKEGDFVAAIGNPAGNMYSISYGVVLTKPITKYITDRQVSLFHTNMTCIDGGGGVVMDSQGNVVGIITNRFNNEQNSMVSFMGVSELEELLDILIHNRRMPYMGIVAGNISSDYMNDHNIRNGIYITNVNAGSPAEDANLIAGDIILSVAGEPVKDVLSFNGILAKRRIGEEVEVDIYRPYAKVDSKRTVKVVLTESMR